MYVLSNSSSFNISTTQITNKNLKQTPHSKREESITITMNLPKAVDNYFNIIRENISKRERYKKLSGRLDYLLLRRFLWTAFNNVSELDLLIVTPKIKALSHDLKVMSRLYDDFMKKIKKRPQIVAGDQRYFSCILMKRKIKNLIF
jgi:hypothetical protein